MFQIIKQILISDKVNLSKQKQSFKWLLILLKEKKAIQTYLMLFEKVIAPIVKSWINYD